ncbi:MAG: hypothetical protein JNG90_15105 [Planctomycetaceae bacterium]|nr:hypothetical protein [Planctomycetaceae bacterium]
MGFRPDEAGITQHEHYGLLGMRERASQIGAQLTVDSAPGQGTRVTVTLPSLPAVDPPAQPATLRVEE